MSFPSHSSQSNGPSLFLSHLQQTETPKNSKMPLSLSTPSHTTSTSTSTATSTPASDPPEISPSLIKKKLMSLKPAIRNRMARNLSSLLPSLSPLPKSSLRKIWKGIFNFYRHSDSTVYQSEPATTILALISTNSHDSATAFLDAALLTLRREWGSIDILCKDNLYLLVRRILRHTFLLLRLNSWDLDLLSKVMSIVEKRAFGEVGSVNEFSYHVVEIFTEELKGFLPLNKESLELLIYPFLTILEKSTNSILVEKVKVHIFEKFLVNGVKYLRSKKTGGQIEKGSEVDLFGVIILIMRFSEKLINLVLKAETRLYNGDDVWDLRGRFYKLEQHMFKNGIEVEIPVPEQIDTSEICTEFTKNKNSEVPNEKLTKKRKRNKKEKEKGEKNSETKNKKKIMKIEKESNSENENGTKGDERENEGIIDLEEFDKTKLFLELFDNAGSKPATSSRRRLVKMWQKKRLRFSLEDNIEWEPGTPLPPISVRLPPRATSRGSALKKGVPAGPIREMDTPVVNKWRPAVMSEEARKGKRRFDLVRRRDPDKRKCRKRRRTNWRNQRNGESSCGKETSEVGDSSCD